MKDRTITQELNTSRVRSGLKNETGEAQSEVKLTKTNGVSPFKCTKMHHHFKMLRCVLAYWCRL